MAKYKVKFNGEFEDEVFDTEREADTMLFNFRRRPEVVFQGTMALVSGEKNYIFEK